MIKIGKIGGPWGREGYVEVKSYSPFPERFSELKEVYIAGNLYKVEEVKYLPKKIILKLEGIDSIENTLKIRGREIEIPEEEIYILPEDYFYLHELEGCHVYLRNGKEIGVVAYVWEMGESTLLEIAGEKGDILIPFAKSICYLVDVKNKRIEIDPPDGLLELNEV